MTGRRCTVTGAAGLLGRRVVERFLAEGWHVTGLDIQPFPDLSWQPHDHRVVDLAQPAGLDELMRGQDAVVHAAAIADLGRGVSEADVLGVNVASAAAVLFAAEQAGVKRLVQISSQSVLGLSRGPGMTVPDYLPIDEDHPLRPRDGYALSKMFGEELAALVAKRSGATAVAIRLPVIWEPDNFDGHVAKRIGDPGQAARSNWAYVDARDAAAGIVLAATRPLDGFHVFNLAAAAAFCQEPLPDLVRRNYGAIDSCIPLDGNPSLFSAARAERLLGYRPAHAWSADGILAAGKDD